MDCLQYNSYYQCPGRGDLIATDIPPRVHFPEQPKLYPEDLIGDNECRQNQTDSPRKETYLQ